jgi:hemerythrin-like metal-binding protein
LAETASNRTAEEIIMTVYPEVCNSSPEIQQSIAEEHRLLGERIDQASLMIDKFLSSPGNRSPDELALISALLGELIETAKAHFKHEEASMMKSEFPRFIFHKRDHEYLLTSLIHFASSLSHGTVPVSTDIGVNLRSWLTYHIKKFDEPYVAFNESRKRAAAD